MEAWRTACPRLTIWEDAVSDVEGTDSMRHARVLLTARGRALLAASAERVA
jgi:hypothetical protein